MMPVPSLVVEPCGRIAFCFLLAKVRAFFPALIVPILHKDTKKLLEYLLHMLAEEGEDKTFAYIRRELDWKKSPKW